MPQVRPYKAKEKGRGGRVEGGKRKKRKKDDIPMWEKVELDPYLTPCTKTNKTDPQSLKNLVSK